MQTLEFHSACTFEVKMPKVLSLKKVPPKNQKILTQFFQNSSTNKASKHTQNTQSSKEVSVDNNGKSKRKASSLNLETSELEEQFDIEKPCSSNKTEQVSKKIKTDEGVVMEKLGNIEKSHTKENNSTIDNASTMSVIDLNNHESEISLNHVNRVPLSPVKSVENINHASNSYTNENNLSLNKTPKKGGPSIDQGLIAKMFASPVKSLTEEIVSSPKNIKWTPDKVSHVTSPSKSGSTVRALVFNQPDVGDLFNDDWNDEIDKPSEETLDLTTLQRCEVVAVKQNQHNIELRLKNINNQRGTCIVEGIWLDTPITSGEMLSVVASRNSSGDFSVGNSSGLLVLRPDHLMSCTSVVAGVFCKRKALLQERWRGIDSANTAMTIGILIHELVQKALTKLISSPSQLRSETNGIINDSTQLLYDAGISEEEARSNIDQYIQPLNEFMGTYLAGQPRVAAPMKKDKWNGQIDKVLDIEENMCCPQLGLKGKIDATLQVTIHDRKGGTKAVMPLELKSGRASGSAEHRGQVVLYGMMRAALCSGDVAKDPMRGLLLYLKDRMDVREVSCGYPERRDLTMLRNQLVQYIAKGPEQFNADQLTDIEDASRLLQQNLPEPVNHHNACSKCPYLTLCSLHLWHTDGPSVSVDHPLSKLRTEALGHLTPRHVTYFLHWTTLLKLEERCQMTMSPLHALWTDDVEKRSKRGTCAAKLSLKSVELSGDRYLHKFQRNAHRLGDINKSNTTDSGPREGEFSIVSIDNRPWIAAGVISLANENFIEIFLERDLSSRQSKETLYHIDTYESYATTVQNLTNLGVLMEDTDRARQLRSLIIDKEESCIAKKLDRQVGRLGARVMRSLNIEQQRAVLRALAATHYALLRGLPGTGKTETISVLIQMLVGLKQRVLVTAHTHSAVDTVLCRLPESLRIMRLGSSARVAPKLKQRTEETLIAECKTVAELEKLYETMEVVGVTCLGATHAMLSRNTFDVCIVDEATQVLQCTVLRPLFAAKRFVLVGDPDQLPPVVRSKAARRLGMEESLFHRLMNEEAMSTLQLQYRMNQPLTDVANRVAYNARLKCANEQIAQARLMINTDKIQNQREWLQRCCSPEPEDAAIFLDVNTLEPPDGKKSKKCINTNEACVVLAVVEALAKCGVNSLDVGVIAPYRDQVSLLRRCLNNRGVEVSTVDQFQGRDKSVIIYSCTRSDEKADDKKNFEGEVLNDQRRLAVSVTRAKHKLIVIGNSRVLQRYDSLQRLIEASRNISTDPEEMNEMYVKYRTIVL